MNKLRSESNLWNKKNNGLILLESLLGEFDIDVGFAGASNTMQ